MSEPTIEKEALFARLALGRREKLTVVTPNQRLAQGLMREFDRVQLARGLASWDEPDILPFSTFIARCHEESRYSSLASSIPVPLSGPEEQLLWEEAVRASQWSEGLLSIAAAAALAGEAWQLAHAWGIAGAIASWPGPEDAQAFAAWCKAFLRRTDRDGFTDTARQPAVVAALLGQGAFDQPATLVAFAFDMVTPQQGDFFSACERAGIELHHCAPAAVDARVQRVVFRSPREELVHASRWARDRAEKGGPAARIAIVVPELSQRRREVARILSRLLVTPGDAHVPPFNISLGEPLADQPLVDAALAIIDLALASLSFDRLGRLLRAPFLAHAEQEREARARLDVELRRSAPESLALPALRPLVAEAVARRGVTACRELDRVLEALALAGTASAAAAPHEWSRRFTAILDAAGFPGERALDSDEFQAIEKFQESLRELATLGGIAPRWTAQEARARLKQLCTDTVFQSASGDAPIQVLGILESAGLEFDHLWISGMTDEAWPITSRPHPLLPAALQRKAGMPQAAPETSLEVDRRITQAWRGAAREVVFSCASADGDRELLPSPLVADLAESPEGSLGVPEFGELGEALFVAGRAAGAFEARSDAVAPRLGIEAAQGGTSILADQSACPFRAYAHFRLNAQALERPESGLGPAERGQLLHLLMARLWRELRDHETLVGIEASRLSQLVEEAAAHAVAKVQSDRPGRLEDRFAELERERLAKIAHGWLQIERGRPPFEVILREEKMTLAAGALELKGRIDRLDRLEGGGLAVIDYKSGQVSVSSWFGDRPDDPQLPLYVLAAREDVRAVAFARLKTGALGFAGLAREAGLLPGVETVEKNRSAKKHAESWDALMRMWREQVDRLGGDFARGDARVDPKRALATCERCDLKPLCRVHERIGALAEGEPFTPEESP
jgi:probable DNA repair protein